MHIVGDRKPLYTHQYPLNHLLRDVHGILPSPHATQALRIATFLPMLQYAIAPKSVCASQ